MREETPNTHALWANATLAPFERAELLVAAMSFDDKVNLVMGNTAALAQLGPFSLEKVDASGGLRGDSGVTAFPAPIALAATFDRTLAYAYGAAIGTEARAHGWSVILGPTVDVERRGNSGRLPEGFGEDPLLNGLIGERVSRGMQDQHLITCLKHFSAYTQESDRNTLDLSVSERTLHEIYNAPFYTAIEHGSALSIMGAYPRVNGAYACENAVLMDQLRAETGWLGFMMSDFMAGEDPVAGFNAGMDTTTLYPRFPREAFSDGRIAPERLDQAVRRTLYAIFAAGLFEHPVGALDQAKSVSTPAHKMLAKRVAEDSIVLLKNDTALLPLSRERIRKLAVIGCAGRDAITGPEGSSYVKPGEYSMPLDAIKTVVGEHTQVLFAQGSSGDHPLPVIPSSALRTPDGALPGLLGTFFANPDFSGEPFATQVMPTLDFKAPPLESLPGGWSARWTGMLTSPVSELINFSVMCSGDVKVYLDGTCIIAGQRDSIMFFTGAYFYTLRGSAQMRTDTPVEIVVEFSTPFNMLHTFMGKHLHLGWQPQQFDEAVAVASAADVAIVVVNQVAGEGMDRDSFSLPGDQDRLIEAVSAVNNNTIVVLNTPGAVLMPWIEQVRAVLQLWYPGEAIGTALAAVLFGDAEPGGRLPLSFPASEAQTLPPYRGGGRIELVEETLVGYRHFQHKQHTPLFAFGHGLSYTHFEYADLSIAPSTEATEVAQVTVRVRNVGSRAGSDVVQVYVGEEAGGELLWQLAGFAKVALQAGESHMAIVALPRRVLRRWNASANGWVSQARTVKLAVASSSVAHHLYVDLSLPPL